MYSFDRNSIFESPSRILLIGCDNKIAILKSTNYKLIKIIQDEDFGFISSICELDEDNYLIGCEDGKLYVINVKTLKHTLVKRRAHEEDIICMINIGNNTIISGSYDKSIKIWSITKVNAKNPNKEKEVDIVINKVIYSTLTKMVESYQKEFKVKIRNMFKNLIINFGYEKVKQATEEKHHSLISYINKHIVKKAKEISAEEELMHGYNPNDLDDTVMMDNEENLIDEEEEYIKKEFKKLEKKIEDKDKKIIKNIENLTIYDDDVDERRRKELELAKKEEEKDKAKDERADKIEELFVKDNVELNNFFYVNPYAQQDKAQKEKELKSEKKDKDVIYDTKKGKLIVKDLEREIQEAKIAKKKKREAMLHGNSSNEPAIEKGNNLNFLMKKRVQNVYKDKDEIDYGSDDDTNSKRKKKMKGNDNTERNSGKPLGHYVKYSGDEYKSKKAKGDKLLQGKYEPFAYIQLNPKSIGTKGKKANLKVFEELMKNDNKK